MELEIGREATWAAIALLAAAVVLGIFATRFVSAGGDGKAEAEARRVRREELRRKRERRERERTLAKARSALDVARREESVKRSVANALAGARTRTTVEPNGTHGPKGGPSFRPAEEREGKEPERVATLSAEERTSAVVRSVTTAVEGARAKERDAAEASPTALAQARARIALAEAESRRELERQERAREQRALEVRRRQERLEEARRRRDKRLRAARGRVLEAMSLARELPGRAAEATRCGARACSAFARDAALRLAEGSRALVEGAHRAFERAGARGLAGRLAVACVLVTGLLWVARASYAALVAATVVLCAVALAAVVLWATWPRGGR